MEITLEQLSKISCNEYVYVDVRDKISYQHGHITNALWWGGTDESILPQNKKLILYCSYGEKSIPLTEQLNEKGFKAYNLSGGYRSWLLNAFGELSTEEIQRYDRQLILSQIGTDGQKKLKKSKVLIVGAGGLGSPVALYLAGAGVGTIGIIDADTVSISNLQRQIIHSKETENRNKADSAKQTLQKLNDKITITSYPFYLTAENAEKIISGYDFVIDATDNFPTKFLINDVCVLLKKPFCHAGILQFEGQVVTYVPGEYPCYRCIFENVPSDVPNCSQTGVIGAIAGVIGSIQALEAIKYLLEIGELLTGKIFIFDGLSMKTRLVNIKKKNPNCKVCNGIVKLNDLADEYMHNICNLHN